MGAPRTNFIQQDTSAWEQARSQNTAQAYANYLALWPEGHYAAEAHRRARQIREENLWTWANSQHKIVSYEKYLSQYPEGYYSREAYEQIADLEERMAWDKATQENTIAAYLQFRREYANSSHSEIAAQRIVSLVKARNVPEKVPQQDDSGQEEDRALQRATMQDSVMAYNQFLRDFPETPHRAEVSNRIQQLQQRLSSEFQLLENELETWDKAARIHTRYGYQQYLDRYPEGKFANVAKNRIKALDQQWRWKHRTLVEDRLSGDPVETDSRREEFLEKEGQSAARTLGWIWLASLAFLGSLSIWLAAYLLPMVVVVGLALGAHFVMNRGPKLSRNESLPYLIGGSLALGALVQGLLFQVTGQLRLSLLGASLMVILGALGFARFFQIQIDKGASS